MFWYLKKNPFCFFLKLPSQENDIYENASQCLSLLVQLYGGDAMDSMSPEDMDSLAEVLQCKKEVKDQKLLLRIIKRLVSQLLL